jgi:hypothetical protein
VSHQNPHGLRRSLFGAVEQHLIHRHQQHEQAQRHHQTADRQYGATAIAETVFGYQRQVINHFHN